MMISSLWLEPKYERDILVENKIIKSAMWLLMAQHLQAEAILPR